MVLIMAKSQKEAIKQLLFKLFEMKTLPIFLNSAANGPDKINGLP